MKTRANLYKKRTHPRKGEREKEEKDKDQSPGKQTAPKEADHKKESEPLSTKTSTSCV
jgi:hypothetical protein